jgi:hypothetical protein
VALKETKKNDFEIEISKRLKWNAREESLLRTRFFYPLSLSFSLVIAFRMGVKRDYLIRKQINKSNGREI